MKNFKEKGEISIHLCRVWVCMKDNASRWMTTNEITSSIKGVAKRTVSMHLLYLVKSGLIDQIERLMKTLAIIFTLITSLFACQEKPDYHAGYEKGYVDGSENSFAFIVDVDGSGHWGTKNDTIYLSKYCEPGVWDVGFLFERIGIWYDPFDSVYVLQYTSEDSSRYIQRRIPEDSVKRIYWHVISYEDK